MGTKVVSTEQARQGTDPSRGSCGPQTVTCTPRDAILASKKVIIVRNKSPNFVCVSTNDFSIINFWFLSLPKS